MSGWIFVDKESEGGDVRSQMRRNMRSGYRNYGGSSAMMRDDMNEHYRRGYRHGWEDHEDDTEQEYRRRRDSMGRYI